MTTTNSQGFTLIELIVVIAIFAIGAAIAFPSLMDIGRRGQVKTEARQLKDQLARSRATAIEQKRLITVTLTTNNYTIDGTNTVLRNGATITTNPAPPLKFPATITWNERGYPNMVKGDGTAITDEGTIVMIGPGVSYSITVTVAGGITIN
nr:prepilin-type N-terminal cleavage/methylation domain-containing protein [uncultured Desulfuromonas sp.]